MTIYPVGAALAAHLEELVPEHAVHALPDRFEMQFASPPKIQEGITSVPWRLPPQTTAFHRTHHLWPAPQFLDIMFNSILWGHSACNAAEIAIGPCS